MRKISSWLVAAVLTVLTFTACAQNDASYTEGKHYKRLATPVFAGGKDVQVTEFFWYGCGHCYTFEPLVSRWKKTLPEGVKFIYSPAMWAPVMSLHAKMYYTAQALGKFDDLHGAIFNAMMVEKKRLASEEEIKALFVANGVDAAAFDKTFSSFGVNGQVRQAESRMRGAKVSGTPMLMVNGKYTIDSRAAGGQANMLKIADYLIAKELSR